MRYGFDFVKARKSKPIAQRSKSVNALAFFIYKQTYNQYLLVHNFSGKARSGQALALFEILRASARPSLFLRAKSRLRKRRIIVQFFAPYSVAKSCTKCCSPFCAIAPMPAPGIGQPSALFQSANARPWCSQGQALALSASARPIRVPYAL